MGDFHFHDSLSILEGQLHQLKNGFGIFAEDYQKNLNLNPQSNQQHLVDKINRSMDEISAILKEFQQNYELSHNETTTAAAQQASPALPASAPTKKVIVPRASSRLNRIQEASERQSTPQTLRQISFPSARISSPSRASTLSARKGPTFRCNYRDFSEKLNESKFEKFRSNPIVQEKGYFKLVIEDLPALSVDEGSIKQPGKFHCTNFSCRIGSPGFIHTAKEENQKSISLLNFPFVTQKELWSEHEMREFWETSIKNPPRNMHYIIGDPLFDDIQLSPGERLKSSDLRGIGTLYTHLSFGRSLAALHEEDAEFDSMNVVRCGEPKLWLIIEPASAENLKQNLRREYPQMEKCSQGTRHLSLLIAPSKLDEWGIGYSLDYCPPGEAVVTKGSLHQIGNPGNNQASSINILYSSAPIIPKGYKFCSHRCGPNSIKESHLQLLLSLPTIVDKVVSTEAQALFIGTKKREAKRDPSIVTKKRKVDLIKSSRHIRDLVEAVCSRDAFQRLCSLIYAWRNQYEPLFEIKQEDVAFHLVSTIESLGQKSQLNYFLDRLAKVILVEDLNRKNRMRADKADITKLLRKLKWEDTDRGRLQGWLKEGRVWERVCGSFKGLLCLIPPNRDSYMSGSIYQELSDTSIKEFHSLLQSETFFMPLYRIGYMFQTAICNKTEIPQFIWEGEDTARLSMKKLVPLMAEFPIITENIYRVERWQEANLCHDELLQDPTLPTSTTLCQLCNSNNCRCIETCLPQNTPRVVNEEDVGRGIRGIGMTYPKGQILGELVGEVVPLDTYNNDRAIEFIRPDLSDQPVAQIYVGEMGNWVGYVNHSCRPSAKFQVMLISGRWRQMLVATQDIHHYDKITAFCGRRFLKEQGKLCLCDVCK